MNCVCVPMQYGVCVCVCVCVPMQCGVCVTHATGGVEFRQQEHAVLLSGLQHAVLVAPENELVAQREAGRQAGGPEAGGDVGPAGVRLLQLPRLPGLSPRLLQQLRGKTANHSTQATR